MGCFVGILIEVFVRDLRGRGLKGCCCFGGCLEVWVYVNKCCNVCLEDFDELSSRFFIMGNRVC